MTARAFFPHDLWPGPPPRFGSADDYAGWVFFMAARYVGHFGTEARVLADRYVAAHPYREAPRV